LPFDKLRANGMYFSPFGLSLSKPRANRIYPSTSSGRAGTKAQETPEKR
jgi:hypothetical protein